MVQEIVLESDEYKNHSGGTMTAIAQYCQDLYQEYSSSSYRTRKLKEIEDGRKRYDNDRPAKDFPWKKASNKSMGLTAIAVDNLEPRVFNKLVAEDDFIQVRPTEASDAEYIDDVREFMHWGCHNNMHVKKHMKSIVHDILMDGTKDVIPLWEEKDITVRIRGQQPIFMDQEGNRVKPPAALMTAGSPEQVMQQLMSMGIVPAGSEEGVKEESHTEFKIHLEALKIEDCFFPDHNDNWDDQPFLRLIYPKLGDLVQMQKDGVYKNITNQLVKGVKRESTEDEERKDIQYSDYGQECELLECYFKWEGEWRLATFSMDNNWTEVRNQPMSEIYWHGRKPVKRFKIYPKSNESMGTGIPKKIEHFDTGINDLYNQMIDSGTIENIPFYFYNASSTGMVGAKKHVITPGSGIPIPKDSNIFFPPVAQKSQGFINFINLLLTFFERTLSLMDYSAGTRSTTTGAGGDTAAGLQMILQEGNIKHNYTGETLQDVFAELLTDCLSLYAQNIPMSAKIRLFKENEWLFKPINIQAIQGRYDLKIDVSDASANTMTNRNDALALMGATKDLPFVNQIQNVQDLFKSFGKRSVEKYINPQYALIMQALTQAPELQEQVGQLIQQYMQQKADQERQQEIRSQAEANIERQEIEREVEAPYENRKIVDQANESYKRKTMGQVVEAIGGIPEMPAA